MPRARDIGDLYVLELRTALAAELEILEVLGLLAEQTDDAQLRNGLRRHRAESEEHARNLQTALRVAGAEDTPASSHGVEGLWTEHESFTASTSGAPAALRDLVVARSAAHLELYEIGTYEALVSKARLLELDDVAELLEETLDEERAMLAEGRAIADRLARELTRSGSRA